MSDASTACARSRASEEPLPLVASVHFLQAGPLAHEPRRNLDMQGYLALASSGGKAWRPAKSSCR